MNPNANYFQSPSTFQPTLTVNPNANYFSQPTAPVVKPVSVLSSSTGQNIVNQNTGSLQKIESGYMGPSIVDYLSSTGQGSDFTSRSKLAGEKGIQGYTGSAEQNTQLLQALRSVSSSPASSAMVQDINKAVQGGGMTSTERDGLTKVQTTQDELTSAVAKARAALESKDYRSMDYWTAQAEEKRKQYEADLSEYYNSTKELRSRLVSTMTPSEKEQELSSKLVDIRSQAERFKLQTEQNKFSEYEGQTMGFAGGRASEIDRKASFKNQEFALQEKNLLLSLGLEQDARKMKGESIEKQLTYLADDFDLQTKVQEKLDAQEESLFNKADKLETEAKNNLISIINELQGVDPSSLDDASLKQLEDLSARSGLPFNLVIEALSTQHAKLTFDNALKVAQENRLGSKSGESSKTTQERLSQILDGFATFDDLTTTEATKVRDELYAKGFGSDTPPAWFKEYIENELQQSILPNKVKEEWIKYRDGILKNANKKKGGGSLEDELFNNA